MLAVEAWAVRALMPPGELPAPGFLDQAAFRPAARLYKTPFTHEDLLLAAFLAPALPQRPGGTGGGGMGPGGYPGGGGTYGGGGGTGGRGAGGTGGATPGGGTPGGTRGGATPGGG